MDGDASESAWEAACEVLNGEVFESYTQMLWMGLKMKAAYLPGC